MNASLSYTEQILAQMHTRALRGVILALVLSFTVHLGITLVKLGGDSFAIRFDAPIKSGDSLKAQIQPRPQPPAPPAPAPDRPTLAAPPVTPAPPPVLRDRTSVNLVERESITPIAPVTPTPAPTEPIPMPAPLPEPVTRRFETDRSNAPTRVERSERLPNIAAPTTVPPLELKPLPPLDITPAKREPLPQKSADAAKPVEPPKAAPEPAPAPPSEAARSDAPKEAAKTAASEPPKSAPAETAKEALPNSPQNAPAAPATAAPTLPATPAPAAPTAAAPSPVLTAPSSSAAAQSSTSAASPPSTSSAGTGAPAAGSRGATVTLPGSGTTGSAGAASPSGASGASSGASDGARLRPGFIDGFDADAARRNAARDAARELNSRRALVPPSVAPSLSAREREAKAIEEAVREDCKEKMARDPNLLAVPLIVAGQLVDKGCRIR